MAGLVPAIHVVGGERRSKGNRARLFRRFHERGEVGFDEIGAHEQVTRRIAAKKHFRRENELRAERAGFFIAGCKLLPVGRKITDGRIELENANFQCVESNRNRQFRNEFACAATRPPARVSAMALTSCFPRCKWLRPSLPDDDQA